MKLEQSAVVSHTDPPRLLVQHPALQARYDVLHRRACWLLEGWRVLKALGVAGLALGVLLVLLWLVHPWFQS